MIRRILSIGIGIYYIIYIYYTHFEIMFFRISDLGFVNSHTLPECGGPGVVQKRGFDWKNDPFSTMVTGETSETEKRGQNS